MNMSTSLPISRVPVAVALLALHVAASADDREKKCAPDSVASGNVCFDKYEASVWSTRNQTLIRKIREGTVTRRELIAGGAVQRGVESQDYETSCLVNGAGCKNIYAVSIPGVIPSGYISWFQAAAAARNAGKRLPTSAEWQVAALGTPDEVSGTSLCNENEASAIAATGSRKACVSDVGVYDMVGNVEEWVADWTARSTECTSWDNNSLSGQQCLNGASTEGSAGAYQRGGSGADDPGAAGVYAIKAIYPPNMDPTPWVGFRAVR